MLFEIVQYIGWLGSCRCEQYSDDKFQGRDSFFFFFYILYFTS